MDSDKKDGIQSTEPDLSNQKINVVSILLMGSLLLCPMLFGTSINQLTNDLYLRSVYSKEAKYSVDNSTFKKLSPVGCVYSVFGVFGAIFASQSVDHFGRKPTTIVALIIAIVANIIGCVSLKVSFIMLFVARSIFGFAVAAIMVVVPTWMVELLPRKVVSKFTPLIQLFVNLGIIFSAVLSIEEVCTVFFGAVFIFPIILGCVGLIAAYFTPESIKWRMLKKHCSPVIESELKKLRKEGYMEEELNYMQSQADAELAMNRVGVWELLKEKATSIALLVTVSLFMLQQLSGINFILIYFPKIVSNTPEKIVGYYNLGLTCSNCIFSLIISPFVSKFPRKIMLAFGFFGMACGYVLCSIFISHGLVSIEYIAGACALVLFAFQLSIGPIPWFLVFETFHSQASASIQATGVSVMWIFNTFTYLLSPYVEDLPIRDVMLFFFVVNSVFSIFVSFMVVETKKRTIPQVLQQYGEKCSLCC